MLHHTFTRRRVNPNAGNQHAKSGMRHTASARDAALDKLLLRNRQRAITLEALIDKYRLLDDAPSAVQALRSFPAGDISSNFNLPQVLMTQCIIDVLRDLGTEEVVLVREWSRPGEQDGPRGGQLLWPKSTFLESALKAGRMDRPISEIAGSVECCPLIHEMDTLDHVLDTMVVTGFHEVGTVDDHGIITGVILFNDLYRFLLQQIEREEPVSSKKTKDRFLEKAEEDDLVSTPVIRGGGTVKSRLEAIKDRYRSKEIGSVQRMAQDWVEALTTELLILLLVILDISCTIFEQTTESDERQVAPLDDPLAALTGTILLFYTYEACVRVYGYRWSILWRVLDLVDLLVVVASITVYLIVISEAGNARNIRAAVQAARVLRFLRVVKLTRRLRKLLTASKTRYQQDGFNLDLSYVTPSCIAMALPAVGAEANFLNPLEEVQRFFADKHPSHFLIFSLCAERYYDPRLFGGRVERIVIENHNPPLLDQLVSFLEHAGSFLDEDPSNVVAVHCKNGRGRTCVMVCAWLVYCGFVAQSSDAIEWFCQERFRGKPSDLDRETTASQRRYIHYAEQVISEGGFRARRVRLERLELQTCPMVDLDKRCNPWFTVEENLNDVFESTSRFPLERLARDREHKEYGDLGVEVCGDVRITFYDRHEATGRDQIIFYLCFHTAFVPHDNVLQVKKPYIDMACTDLAHKTFKPDFALTLHFERPPGPEPPLRKMQGCAATLREVSERQRGLFSSAKSAAVGSIVFSQDEGDLADCALDPVPDNLSIAPGPPVSHSQTKMYAYTGGSVHNHEQSKRLVSSYRNQQETGNFLVNAITKSARHAVSGNKKRFQQDGFDLDLTYITPRLIAMGFPSKGVEGKYRNNEEDVYRFFQQRHSGHYRIINLCSERGYSLNTFHGSVARYPFPDHNPPPMELILPCCSHIHTWLQSDEDNIVAVHCKAGKGRTGLMIICYLLYGGLAATAAAARKFFDTSRTFDGKGLTIISQIRYVHYFEELLRRRKGGEMLRVAENTSPAVMLRRVRMHTVPHMDRDQGCDPYYSVSVVSEDDHELYEIYASKEHQTVEHIKPSVGRWDSDFVQGQGLRVAGDVHFEFRDQDMLSSERMFSFWVHTQFLTHPPTDMGGKARRVSAEEAGAEGLPEGCWALRLAKREIDQAARDKKNVLFDQGFAVELFFEVLPGLAGTGDRLAEGEKRNSRGKRPLYLERELYQKEEEKASLTGQPILPMEEWILQHRTAVALLRVPSTSEHAALHEPGGAAGAGAAEEEEEVVDGGEAPGERTIFRRESPHGTPKAANGGNAAVAAEEEEWEGQERVEVELALGHDALREPAAVTKELTSDLSTALEVALESVVCGEPVDKGCTIEVTLRTKKPKRRQAATVPGSGLAAKLQRLAAEHAGTLQRGKVSQHIVQVTRLDTPAQDQAEHADEGTAARGGEGGGALAGQYGVAGVVSPQEAVLEVTDSVMDGGMVAEPSGLSGTDGGPRAGLPSTTAGRDGSPGGGVVGAGEERRRSQLSEHLSTEVPLLSAPIVAPSPSASRPGSSLDGVIQLSERRPGQPEGSDTSRERTSSRDRTMQLNGVQLTEFRAGMQ